MSFDVSVREVKAFRVHCGSCCDGGPHSVADVNEFVAQRLAFEHSRAHSEAWYVEEGPGVLCLANEHTDSCSSR
jgi:hypothetical protein